MPTTMKKRSSPRRRQDTPAPPPPPKSPFAQTVQDYIDGVMNGTVPAGKLLRLAVERHVRDLRDGPARGLTFDQTKAEDAIDFFSYLKHSKGEWAGQTFLLEPWQQFIVWCLFGWLQAEGTRRFRTAYVEIPRKNGKSTMGAGVGLKLAFADQEPGAEVYSAATKKDQAIIVHGEATRMVKATPELAAKIQVFKNNLCRLDRAQKYEPLGAEDRKSTRLNSS